MKFRMLSLSLVAMMAFGGTAVVGAADPGPNGNNEHGLCTAFFNGQKNGHDKHGNPGPFAALVEEAGDADGDGTPGEVEDVYAYCVEFGIGGNPEHGRYTCTEDPGDADGDGDEVTCTENEGPGNS